MRHNQRVQRRHILQGLNKAFKSVAHEARSIIEAPQHLASQALHTAGGLGQSLALPLVIIGGIVLVSYLNK